MQIIAVALPVMLLPFVGFAVWGVQNQNQWGGVAAVGPPILTWMSVAALVVILPLSFIWPNFLTRRAVRRLVSGIPEPSDSPSIPSSLQGLVMYLIALYVQKKVGIDPHPSRSVPERLLMQYQTALIVGLTALEGLGFFAGMAYLFEAKWIALFVVGVVVVVMLARFPTKGRVESWLFERLEEIERLRRDAV